MLRLASQPDVVPGEEKQGLRSAAARALSSKQMLDVPGDVAPAVHAVLGHNTCTSKVRRQIAYMFRPETSVQRTVAGFVAYMSIPPESDTFCTRRSISLGAVMAYTHSCAVCAYDL
jgi:hypothetical protein